ncbi:MAG: LruC protein [Cyanobacteria bacterium RYN_339]|nr:LruC protein [Cyanobacteria bacterium RYN_339]
MRKSAFKRKGRRGGFTLIEVALGIVIGSMMLATTAYTSNEVRKAVSNVYDETFLQTVSRDTQLNLDKSMNMVNKDGVPDKIAVSATGMTLGTAQIGWSPADVANGKPGGDLRWSTDNGTSWKSMADIGSRGDFDSAEFAYGKFTTNEDNDIPTPDRTTYALDDRVRNDLMRVTSVLKKNDMVPLYLQQVRAPRSLTWSWNQTAINGDPAVDSDGDGIMDDKDDFPLDPTRAFRERFPATGGQTASLAFEDLYPTTGDADFNDLVSSFFMKETYGPGTKDAVAAASRPALKQVYMRFFAQARGAGYNHAFRMYLGTLVKGGGTVSVYRYDPTGRQDSSQKYTIASNPYVDIFPDTKTQLPASSDGWSTNVVPGTTVRQSWSTVVQVDFDDPTQNRYGLTQKAPYDPFLFVKDTSQEIHLPLFDSNADGFLDSYKFPSGTVKTMLDTHNDAFALMVPTNWAWPLEGQKIDDAFPKYRAWVTANRPSTTDWYLFPRTDRYKNASLNTGGVPAPTPAQNAASLHDYDASNQDRFCYVFDPKLFVNGTNAFLGPTAVATAGTIVVQATPTPAPLPSGATTLYPIALNKNTLTNKNPGDSLGDIFCGGASGNFGWLSWDGDGSAPRLATSLAVPGDSTTYINPDDTTDHIINIGDWIRGNTGISNSSSVRSNLNKLMNYDIVVPVWDSCTGTGANAKYHTYAFAKVRITDYVLPNQNRITATYMGYADAVGLPSTAPTTAPSATPTPAPSASPSAGASPTPSPTATPAAISATNIQPIALNATVIAGKANNTNLGSISSGVGSGNFCWVTWNGDSQEGTWRTNLAIPGVAGSYINPANASDHHLDVGDRLIAFTDLTNSSNNRTELDNLIDNNIVIVVPIFNGVTAGQVAVNGFAKVTVEARSLNAGTDTLNLVFIKTCDSAGN